MEENKVQENKEIKENKEVVAENIKTQERKNTPANTAATENKTQGGEQKPKKKSKKKVIIIIAIVLAVLLLLGIVALIVTIIIIVTTATVASNVYTKNSFDSSAVYQVDSGNYLYTSDERNISFQYPAGFQTDENEDGIYVYGIDKGDLPYILVDRLDKSQKPEKYFKKYKSEVRSSFSGAKFSDIEESTINQKDVYRMMATVTDQDGKTLYLTRYIENYSGYSVVYTTATNNQGNLDSLLYYVVSSLYPSSVAYEKVAELPVDDGIKEDLLASESWTAEVGNFTIAKPQFLTGNESKSIYYGADDSILCAAGFLNTDFNHAAIYDAESFAGKAENSAEFLEEILGLNFVEVRNRSRMDINGRSFISYDINVTTNDFQGEGKICIADTDGIGCYINMYAVSYSAEYPLDYKEVGENFIQSFVVEGAPAIADYRVYDYSSEIGCRIILKSEMVSEVDTASIPGQVNIRDAEDREVKMAKLSEGTYESVRNNMSQYWSNEFGGVSPSGGELYTVEGGNYDFTAFSLQYDVTANGQQKTVVVAYYMLERPDGIYCFGYEEFINKKDWNDTILDDVAWSFEIK